MKKGIRDRLQFRLYRESTKYGVDDMFFIKEIKSLEVDKTTYPKGE